MPAMGEPTLTRGQPVLCVLQFGVSTNLPPALVRGADRGEAGPGRAALVAAARQAITSLADEWRQVVGALRTHAPAVRLALLEAPAQHFRTTFGLYADGDDAAWARGDTKAGPSKRHPCATISRGVRRSARPSLAFAGPATAGGGSVRLRDDMARQKVVARDATKEATKEEASATRNAPEQEAEAEEDEMVASFRNRAMAEGAARAVGVAPTQQLCVQCHANGSSIRILPIWHLLAQLRARDAHGWHHNNRTEADDDPPPQLMALHRPVYDCTHSSPDAAFLVFQTIFGEVMAWH
jgi:hypothetical protein